MVLQIKLIGLAFFGHMFSHRGAIPYKHFIGPNIISYLISLRDIPLLIMKL